MTLHTMKHMICTAIALSVLCLLSEKGVHGGRQEFPTNARTLEMLPERQASPPPSSLVQSKVLLLDQLLAAANENRDAYMELQTYHRRQPNYLTKWPGLRDLLLTAVDYDSNMDTNDNNDPSKNFELANSRLIERLQQLAETSSFSDDLENTRENTIQGQGQVEAQGQGLGPELIQGQRQGEMLPANYENMNQIHFKNHGTKKNVQFRKQFMAPCHFKVCYMGPKRNVRYISAY